MEKSKKAKDIKKVVSTGDILNDKKAELRKFRFDNALGQLSDTSKIKKTKKEIAKILTNKKKEGN